MLQPFFPSGKIKAWDQFCTKLRESQRRPGDDSEEKTRSTHIKNGNLVVDFLACQFIRTKPSWLYSHCRYCCYSLYFISFTLPSPPKRLFRSSSNFTLFAGVKFVRSLLTQNAWRCYILPPFNQHLCTYTIMNVRLVSPMYINTVTLMGYV
jgi:hypothetical protein